MSTENADGDFAQEPSDGGWTAPVSSPCDGASGQASRRLQCAFPECGADLPQKPKRGSEQRYCCAEHRSKDWDRLHPRLGTQKALEFKPPLAGPPAHFGDTYVEPLDGERLKTLRGRIERLMVDGVWRSLEEIRAVTGGSLTGVSAKLRDLRKKQFGGYKDRIMRRRRAGLEKQGVHEYRMR